MSRSILKTGNASHTYEDTHGNRIAIITPSPVDVYNAQEAVDDNLSPEEKTLEAEVLKASFSHGALGVKVEGRVKFSEGDLPEQTCTLGVKEVTITPSNGDSYTATVEFLVYKYN